MCGIFGFIAPPGQVSSEDLAAASSLARHRGPDGHGYLLARSSGSSASLTRDLPDDISGYDIGLAHRRLAILDVSEAGSQPMSCCDGQLWITYNGEVYNFIELRSELESRGLRFRSGSDTEVILRAYEHWGEDCVSRLNGIWAFAILDLRERTLFCSRDRFGVKPFHFVSDPGRRFFAFASEIKQLLAVSKARKNEQAIYEFLTSGSYDHSSSTFFEGVLRLAPGHNMRVDLENATVKTRRYYRPSLVLDRQIRPDDAADRFLELLTDAVRLQLRSDVPVGSCLSGGLDSTSLVCLVRDLLQAAGGNATQHTFSSHFEDAEANEREYMDAAISAAGVRSHIIEPTSDELLRDLDKLVWQQDEPFGSTSIFAQWRVFQDVHGAGIKVMLDGQGADEQLAGYLSFMSRYYSELAGKGKWGRLLWESWRFSRLQGRAWCDVLTDGLGGVPFCGKKASPAPAFDWLDGTFSNVHAPRSEYAGFLGSGPFPDEEKLNNLCYAMVFHNNIPALLRYEDRDSMAWSVEARVPFLDHRIVEFVLALPASLKIRDGATKWVLREGMRGVIPEKIRTRSSKLGFATPESKWQATVLEPMIRDAISDRRLTPYIDPDEARRYFDYVCEQGVRDFLPWRWMNITLWMDRFGLA